MKLRSVALVALLACAPFELDSALAPNRGEQLFVLISGSGWTNIIVMTPPRREILGGWDCCGPVYDFVSAVVQRVSGGSKVRFTRYVMKKDYVARTESIDLFFPYAKQARYSFFDIGWIVGFYRNSSTDFDIHEIFPPMPHT